MTRLAVTVRPCLRRPFFLMTMLVAMLACQQQPSVVLAQSSYGSISGTVTEFRIDPSNPTTSIEQAVKDVEVTIEDERGQRRTTRTDINGRYSFSALNPSSYTVTASKLASPPDNIVDVTDSVQIRIAIGQEQTVDFTLETPSLLPNNKIFKIRSSRLALKAVSPALTVRLPGRQGVNVTPTGIDELADTNRQADRFIDREPGVINTGEGFSINGQSINQNVVKENGIDVTPPIVLSSASSQDTGALLFDISKRQSVKSYQEFRLDTSNYPADQGTGTGGQLIKNTSQGKAVLAGEFYEYLNNDALNARNFFDFSRKPALRFNLFGGKLGGAISNKHKLFFFVNYEGIRARSGATLYEAAPNAAARARAVPSIAPLLNAFFAGGAAIVPNATSDPDFDILQLEAKNIAEKNAITVRLDHPWGDPKKAIYEINLIYNRAQSSEDTPEGVTGRRQVKRDTAQSGVFRFFSKAGNVSNEFLAGLNINLTRLGARSPFVTGVDLMQSAISVGGKVTPSGIEGQPLPLSIATPGGLLRQSKQFRGQLFTPSKFSLIDQVVWKRRPNVTSTFGGEIRLLRTYINIFNGTTYNFANLNSLLENRPTSVQFVGDLGAPSPFNTGAAGDRLAKQEYYIAFAEEKRNVRDNLLLTYGLRYEYYSVLTESQNRAVLFDIDSGTRLPSNTPFFRSAKNTFLPRAAISWAPVFVRAEDQKCKEENKGVNCNPLVISASFGMHAGPGNLTDQLKPIESDRISVTQDGGLFPVDPRTLAATFATNPDRQYQPFALSRDYGLPVRTYKFDISIKYDLITQQFDEQLYLIGTYVGSRSRNLLLRNFANRIVEVQTNPDPAKSACVRREFDIGQGCTIERPYGEIDFRTSGGRSKNDSLQLFLKGTSKRLHLSFLEAQYTLSRNFGNTDGGERTTAAGNTFDYAYDEGYNSDDARHKFGLTAVYDVPFNGASRFSESTNNLLKYVFADWTLGTIISYQSGRPIDVRLKRQDVVYIDASGNVFSGPAAGRRAVINVPGGGSSLDVRRPDLIPGVDPYLNNDRSLLNPAAFAIPAPGTFGNLRRGALRGPSMRLVDLSIRKKFSVGGTESNPRTLEFRVDISNLFNFTNFDRPLATLPDVLGTDVSLNQIQPGQPFSSAAAGTFGLLNRTFKREQDLGASRQIQFSLAFKFGPK